MPDSADARSRFAGDAIPGGVPRFPAGWLSTPSPAATSSFGGPDGDGWREEGDGTSGSSDPDDPEEDHDPAAHQPEPEPDPGPSGPIRRNDDDPDRWNPETDPADPRRELVPA